MGIAEDGFQSMRRQEKQNEADPKIAAHRDLENTCRCRFAQGELQVSRGLKRRGRR